MTHWPCIQQFENTKYILQMQQTILARYVPNSFCLPFQYTVRECRHYSARKGFFSSIIENIKDEMAKNKEMKDNIKKFREEAQKLENSEALMVCYIRLDYDIFFLIKIILLSWTQVHALVIVLQSILFTKKFHATVHNITLHTLHFY